MCIRDRPDSEITFPSQEVANAMSEFYSLYEQLFGTQNCTYTVHVVCSHLLAIRNNMPLTETSAFQFENFYSELRHSYAPGTPSTLKQIFQSTLLRRILGHHCCIEDIFYSKKDTELECNSLVYCYENGQHNMFKIKEMSANTEEIICTKQGRYTTTFIEKPTLPWGTIGVYEVGGTLNDQVTILKKNISGKVIKVGNYLMTCPKNILREK